MHGIPFTFRHIRSFSPIQEKCWIWLFLHEAEPSPEIYIGPANQSGTPAELALLMDYLLLHVCEGNDYDACNWRDFCSLGVCMVCRVA